MKETKEALIALVMIGKFVSDRLKDGAQMDDALALGQKLMDPEFKKVVEAGYKDAEKISEEFQGFNMAKGFELVQVLPQLVEILNKKSA